MTPEKRESAIAWLNDEIRSLRLAPTINGCDMKPEWAEQLEIMETCLEAVKVCSVDTNKTSPLTLEHLREMDGKAAYLPETNCWVLVTKNPLVPLFTFPDGEQCNAVEWYETVGPAYAYPPAHIDREAWTAEWKEYTGADAGFHYCSKCGQQAFNYEDGGEVIEVLSHFCPSCGRAMTTEAWAEMEKRLRG